ncbi:Hypothetical predicted protein [Olea europaea subsp. europaea]|uniref:Uncharacterized protein n=1 Tax=Olea europaea subsp. europaea TaxID=158383 RepID=A0A8S0R2P9_OLEEU|nr:Hypothetical predicted protein [Olea europaea subsp. europaea]
MRAMLQSIGKSGEHYFIGSLRPMRTLLPSLLFFWFNGGNESQPNYIYSVLRRPDLSRNAANGKTNIDDHDYHNWITIIRKVDLTCEFSKSLKLNSHTRFEFSEDKLLCDDHEC